MHPAGTGWRGPWALPVPSLPPTCSRATSSGSSGPSSRAPLPSSVYGNDKCPRARTDPQHNTSNSRVFQNPHHTAVPRLPPSVGSTENQTNTAQVVKITLLVAGAGESLGCRIRGSYPWNSPGFTEHTRRPGHPLLRALSRAGAMGVGR